MRGGVVVTMLLSAMLAGCSGSEAPEDPDALSGEIVELAPGIVVAVELGAVRGQVRNEASLPVPQARVQLTGTEFFAKTGETGGFRFVNVTPGVHTLRVERDGFMVLEEPVNITAASLTETTVHLLPDGSRGAGYRPHVHNMWAGQTEHTLFDGPFEYTESMSESDFTTEETDPLVRATLHANRNESTSLARIPIPEETEDGRPNLVYPGAGHIEVTVSWDTTTTLSEVGIAYEAPGSDLDTLGQKPSGSTWTIPVERGEADVGHQPFTFWEFFLYPGNDVLQPGYEPAAILGPFDITVTAFKGSDPPVEPEHPDFWGQRTRLVLMTDDEPAYEDSTTVISNRHRDRGHIKLEDNLVPPATVRMLVNHTWEYQDLDQEAAGTVVDQPYVLTWRTADQNPHATHLSEYRRQEGTSCGHHCVSYDLEMDPAWTDAFYQDRSLWAFVPSIEGYEDEPDFRPDPRRNKTHYLEITVWRE